MPVKPERCWLVRYGVAVLAVLLALLVMLFFERWVPMRSSPFLVFFAAVMVSAWYGGFGTGLCATAIARQLVELRGGIIQVDSPGMGQGATFVITLPLLSDSQTAYPVGAQALE